MITFGVKGVLVGYTVAMVTIVLNKSVKFIQQWLTICLIPLSSHQQINGADVNPS